MPGTKTKKVTLTVKNPPRAQTKSRKGRNNATSDSPVTNGEMRPGLADINAGIEDEASAGGIDSRPNRGLPSVPEVDTTTDDVPTVQNLQREFNLVKGQLLDNISGMEKNRLTCTWLV
jgi:hypothetical protein